MDINIATSQIARLTETAIADTEQAITLMDGTYAVSIEFVGTEGGADFVGITEAPQYRVTDVTGGDQDADDITEALKVAAEFIANAVEDDAANAADWADARRVLLGLFS